MELSKELIKDTLEVSKHWKPGQQISFTFIDWDITITREEKFYEPFQFRVDGHHQRGSSFSRRYMSIEKALLHILNHFNENVNVNNRYSDLQQYMK